MTDNNQELHYDHDNDSVLARMVSITCDGCNRDPDLRFVFIITAICHDLRPELHKLIDSLMYSARIPLCLKVGIQLDLCILILSYSIHHQ
jgi:hypothetical protein